MTTKHETSCPCCRAAPAHDPGRTVRSRGDDFCADCAEETAHRLYYGPRRECTARYVATQGPRSYMDDAPIYAWQGGPDVPMEVL